MLVGVGSALFTIVSAYAWGDFVFDRSQGTVFDPTRIAAQIVTGIGFLGAGAIIRQGLSVRGLTTAAGLWVVAAIGMAVGRRVLPAGPGHDRPRAGRARPLAVVRGLARAVPPGGARPRGRPRALSSPSRAVLAVLEGRRSRVDNVELEDEEDSRKLRIELDLPFGGSGRDVIEELSALDEVIGVRWRQ